MTNKIVIIVSTSLLILFSLILAVSIYDFHTDSKKKDVKTRNSSAQVSGVDKGQYLFQEKLQRYNVARQNEEKENTGLKIVTKNYTNFTKRYRLFKMLLLNDEREKRNDKRKMVFDKNISQQVWEPMSHDIENSTPTIKKIFSKFSRFRMKENESKVDEIKVFKRRFIPRHMTENNEDTEINKGSIIGLQKFGKYKNIAGKVYKTCDSCDNGDESRKKRSAEQSSDIADKSEQELKKLLQNMKSEEDISLMKLETTSQTYEKTSETGTEKSEYIIKYIPQQSKTNHLLKLGNNQQRKITENLKNEIQRILLEGVARNLPFAQVVDKLNNLENSIETIFQEMHLVLKKFDRFFNKMVSHLHGDEKSTDQITVPETMNKFTNEKKTLSNSRRTGHILDVYNRTGQGYSEEVNLFQSLINKLNANKEEKDKEILNNPATSSDLFADLTSLVKDNIEEFNKSVPNYAKKQFVNRKSKENNKSKVGVEGENKVHREIALPKRKYFIPSLEEMYDKKISLSQADVEIKKPKTRVDYEKRQNNFNINNVLHTLLEKLETKHGSKETIDYFDSNYKVGDRKSASNIKIKGEIIYSSPNGMFGENNERNNLDKKNKNIERLVTTLYQDISTKYKDGDVLKAVFDQLHRDSNKNDIEKLITYLIEYLSGTYGQKKPEKTFVLELLGNFRETKSRGPYTSKMEQTVKKTINEKELEKPYPNDVLLKLLKTYLEKNVASKNIKEHLAFEKTRFRRSLDNDNKHGADEGLNYNNPDRSRLQKKSVFNKIFKYIINFLSVDCNKRKKEKLDLNNNLNKHKFKSNVGIEKRTNTKRHKGKSIFKIGDFIHDMHERILKEMGKDISSGKSVVPQLEKKYHNILNKNTNNKSHEYLKKESPFIYNNNSIEDNFIEIGRLLQKTANEKTKMYESEETQLFEELKNDLGYSQEVEFASTNRNKATYHINHRSQNPVSHERVRRNVPINSQTEINEDNNNMKTSDNNNVANYNANPTLDSQLKQDIGTFLDFLSDQGSSTSTSNRTNYKENKINEENRNETLNIKIENTLEQPTAKLLDFNARKWLRNKHKHDYEKIRDDIFGEISDSQENRDKNYRKLEIKKKIDSNERFSRTNANKYVEFDRRLSDEESVDNDYKIFLKKNMKPIDIFEMNDNFDNTRRNVRSTTNIEVNSSEGLRVTGSTIRSHRHHRDSQMSERDKLHNLFNSLVSKNIVVSKKKIFLDTNVEEKTKKHNIDNNDRNNNMFEGIFDFTHMLESHRQNEYRNNIKIDKFKPISDETHKRTFFKHNKKKKIIKLTREQLNDLIINAHLNLKSIENKEKKKKTSMYTDYNLIGNEMIPTKNISLVDLYSHINSTNLINKIDNLSKIVKSLEKITNKSTTKIPPTTEDGILMDEILMCKKIANSTDSNTTKGLLKILKTVAEKNKITHNFASFRDQIIHICDGILNGEIKGPIKTLSDINSAENVNDEPVILIRINENQSINNISGKESNKNKIKNNEFKNKLKVNENSDQNIENLTTKISGNDFQAISEVNQNTVLEPMMLYEVDKYDINHDKPTVPKHRDKNELRLLSFDNLIASPVVLNPLGMAVVYSDSEELVTNDSVILK